MSDKAALATLAIILAVVNWSILGKEKHLADGRKIYLELAPVDPRSLMQGDYMALRFRLADEVRKALPRAKEQASFRDRVDAADGYVVVNLDEQNIATFKRIHKDDALGKDVMLLRYRVRNGVVKFATNAFFFQEGHAKYYEAARYGLFSVDDAGELLLMDMYAKGLKKLGPDEKS